MKKEIIKAFIIDTLIWLSLISLFSVPIFLYILGANDSTIWSQHTIQFLKSHSWEKWLFFLGIIIFLVQVIILYTINGKSNTLFAEIKFIFSNGKHALFLGFSISFVFLALYFHIPQLSKIDRFGTSFGIFGSIMAIVIGIHFIYELEAPLIGTLSLLKKINIDLGKFHHGNIYIVFPALNLGFYTDEVQNEKNIYNDNPPDIIDNNNSVAGEFFIKLKKCKTKFNAKIYGFILEEKYIEKLYSTYHYMNDKKTKKDCENFIKSKKTQSLRQAIEKISTSETETIKKCIESSNLFNSWCGKNLKTFDPNELPQTMIIINDIVYIIADYGMPFYNQKNEFFEPIETKPAELIGWRRKDSALASSIIKHLEKF